jgi:lipid-A-disaccharide synthase
VESVFRESILVIAASGTVTLESAIWGTPMVIMYKVSPVSFLLGRMLVRINHVGLVNLVAGREIIPEILQDQATGEGIAGRVSRMISDPDGLEDLRRELLAVRERLGRPGACERVADMAMAMLDR